MNRKKSKIFNFKELSSEEINQFYQLFKLLDTNNDGYISANELEIMFKNLKERYTESDINNILKSIDINCDQKISFTEFMKYMNQYCDKKLVENAKEVFEVFDTDRDGFLTVDELYEALKKYERYHNIVKNDVEKIFEIFDTNKDGRINFEEFLKMINSRF